MKHEYFDYCENMPLEKYIQERVTYSIKRYRSKANNCRETYLFTSLAAILMSSSIPILINLQPNINKVIITIISFLVVVLIAIENVFHFRERWKNYQIAEESIRGEKYLLQTKSESYKKLNDKDSYLLFVNRIEKIIKNERESTIQVRSTEIKVE